MKYNLLRISAGITLFLVFGAGHASARSYGVEVWELEPVSSPTVRNVLDYAPSDPVAMGGNRRGFGNGMKTPERVQVEEGTEYVLSFEGRVADSEGSFILYAKVFDEKGRDITMLTNPPGGGWQNSVSSSTYVIFAIPLPSTGAWHRVERSFLPPPGVKSVRFEVSCWRGSDVACRRISITARPRYVRRKLDAAKDAIRIEISEKPKPCGATAVRAKISDLSNPRRPRALQVVLDWRKDLRGWTWHRNWRKDMPISEGSSYALGECIEGIPVSSFPFTAVSKDGEGFAVATALNAAAFEHRVTTAVGIRSMVAVGLLERGADKHGSTAEFEWLLFPFKGSWGFRSAARAYYDIEREHFPPSHAGEKEGAWVFATLPTKLPENPDDFGLTFWEAPETVARDCPKEIARARELGFNIFAYTEAWGMRQAIKKGEDGRFPSETDLLDEIRGWAADAKSGKTWFSAPRHEAAQALLTSLPLTPDGGHPHTKDLYSNWSAWWSTNPDPRLPKPNRMSLCWDRRVGSGMDKVDGVYLDSVAYATPIDYNNVRPEHLAVMDEPLVYDEKTAMPCANGMQHEVAFVRWIAGKLHPARKRIFANIARIALRFHADTIDIFGGETGSWGAPDAVARAHNVVPDDEACQRRFYAYHRPLLSLLQEGHWLRTPPEFTAEGMTNYINNQIFYGIYPGVSTIGGDEKPGYATWRRYFGPLRRCERDRALFKAAIPLIREMNRAGWEPETGFRTGSAKILAERYGTPGSGKVYLAVRNAADAAADAELKAEYAVDRMVPRWGSGREPVLKDKTWRVHLEPWETAVYELTLPSQASSPKSAVPISRPAFVMPDTIYAAPGVECNVYWGEVLDSVRPDRYAFEVRARVGRCENERWTWTPDAKDAGRRERVVFNAWSDEGLACACTATVQVARSKPDASRRVTCALLGDSLTNARYQDRIMKVLHESGWKGYTPVGSRSGPSAEKVGVIREGEAPHDGYGGFTPDSFLTRYALSTEEIDNLQSEAEREQLKSFGVKIPPGDEWRRNLLKSPFVKIVEGRKVVDVQAWLDRVNGGKAPDFVLVLLGVNGTCIQRDDTIAEHCEKVQVASMRELVRKLRAVAPVAKIAIGTCIVGTDQDAFGKNYGCMISAVQSRKDMLYLNRCWMALVKEFNDAGDANVFIVPVGQALDPVHGFPKLKMPPAAAYETMIERSSNAFHPTIEGGKQLGDAFAAWILCNL